MQCWIGTVIYAKAAHRVIAVDTSAQAIEKAKKVNTSENVEYVLLDSWKLPLPDHSVDVTVLFQVIEHVALDKLDAFLREIRRVTRQDGVIITPNRKIRLLPFQKPWNTFHEKSTQRRAQELLARCLWRSSGGSLWSEPLNEIERGRVRRSHFQSI
jgi:ubiquinone/menaquinone biosynthesis C-methylase UbiE